MMRVMPFTWVKKEYYVIDTTHRATLAPMSRHEDRLRHCATTPSRNNTTEKYVYEYLIHCDAYDRIARRYWVELTICSEIDEIALTIDNCSWRYWLMRILAFYTSRATTLIIWKKDETLQKSKP